MRVSENILKFLSIVVVSSALFTFGCSKSDDASEVSEASTSADQAQTAKVEPEVEAVVDTDSAAETVGQDHAEPPPPPPPPPQPDSGMVE